MGLQNREYMRSPYPAPGNDGQQMLLTLIIVNVISFFIFSGSGIALDLRGSFSWINILQLFTAGFAHADFWHLFFNMWGLYIFGKLVTPYLSRYRFLMLYLAGVISGNLLFLLCNLSGGAILLGASGAVCAVMAAAATLEPERRFVMLFMPFSPIKTTTLVICYTALEIIMQLQGNHGGIAHLAHLGGFAGGYIFMKLLFGSRLPWDPLRFLKSVELPKSTPGSTSHSSSAQNRTPDNAPNAPVTQRELDDLLEKLSREGINSLSKYELERLKKARRQMRGEE